MSSKHSNSETPVKCSLKSCPSMASGLGSYTMLHLCNPHLEEDTLKVQKKMNTLLLKLSKFSPPKLKSSLRSEKDSLEAEIQLVGEGFDSLIEKLQNWKQVALSGMQAAHDSVARRLSDTLEADGYATDIKAAKTAGKTRKVWERTLITKSWLKEARSRATEWEKSRVELLTQQQLRCGDVTNVRSVGDVSAGVQQLQVVVDTHMTALMGQVWLTEEKVKHSPVCRPMTVFKELENYPTHVACCTNVSSSFVVDASGYITRRPSETPVKCVPTPKPCLIVAFKRLDYLLAMSIDGSFKFKSKPDLNWTQEINGLLFDKNKSLLHVSQPQVVTVMDVWGTVANTLTAESLIDASTIIANIAGNQDKLFIQAISGERTHIFGVSMNDLRIEFRFDMSDAPYCGPGKMALLGDKILIAENATGRLLKVCAISGQIVGTYPTNQTGLNAFSLPTAVAVDSSGLMFVSEKGTDTVKAISSDGAVLQTLTGQHDTSFNDPCELTVFEDGNYRLLLVADFFNRSLHLFELAGSCFHDPERHEVLLHKTVLAPS